MTERSQRWLPRLVAPLAVAVVAATIASGFHSTKREVIPFEVAAQDLIRLPTGETTRLNNPDPNRVYVVESGSRLSITRDNTGDPSQVKTLRVWVKKGGTLEGAEGTNVYVIADEGSLSHVGDGVFIEAWGGEVFASGTSRVKAMDKSKIHNTGSGDEHAYKGSTTYARMRGRVFAHPGAIVYVKSPDRCDACSQVDFRDTDGAPDSDVSSTTIYIYGGAEAFARGRSPDARPRMVVYDGGEVGCYKYCEVWSYPKAELKVGPYSQVHYVVARHSLRYRWRKVDPILPFPDDGDEQDHD